MNRKAKETKGPHDPIEEAEIRAAVETSGYPLEIRLLKAFDDAGMNPVIGFRVKDGLETSREVDLLASITRPVMLTEHLVNLKLRLVIEAKSIEPGQAFVGFPWNRPRDHDMRVARMYFGGNPSNRIIRDLDRDDQIINGKGGLSEAFDAMNKGPVCVQWAVAKRTKAGQEQRAVANHEAAYWEDIDGVVRASSALMKANTLYRWEHRLIIVFELPVLVLATPNLWLYDARDMGPSNLTTCSSMILSRMFQVDDHVEHRLVDVVAEGGIPSLIAACNETVDLLAERVREHASRLAAIAARQSSALEIQNLEALTGRR